MSFEHNKQPFAGIVGQSVGYFFEKHQTIKELKQRNIFLCNGVALFYKTDPVDTSYNGKSEDVNTNPVGNRLIVYSIVSII